MSLGIARLEASSTRTRASTSFTTSLHTISSIATSVTAAMANHTTLVEPTKAERVSAAMTTPATTATGEVAFGRAEA